MSPSDLIVVTDQTTRAELEITIRMLCAAAKELSRRGKVGTLTEEYATIHGRISAVLLTWETTPDVKTDDEGIHHGQGHHQEVG